MTLKTAFGNRRIDREIVDSYLQFGRSLLNDEDGSVTKAIENNHNGNAAEIVHDIFARWQQGNGRQPVEWSTFIATLRDIGKQELANHIEQNLKHKD